MNEKELADRLCFLAARLWPDEWPGKYTGSREDLRDWMNSKTGLDECHITNKHKALARWVAKMDELNESA